MHAQMTVFSPVQKQSRLNREGLLVIKRTEKAPLSPCSKPILPQPDTCFQFPVCGHKYLLLIYNTSASYPYIGYVGSFGGVHQVRQRVINRLQFQACKIHGGQVGKFAGFDRSDPGFEPQGARSVEC
jgi:hypothetical protein